MGSVAPTPLRLSHTEQALGRRASVAEAQEILQREIAPIDDLRSTAEYRRQVAANLLRQFWDEAGRGSRVGSARLQEAICDRATTADDRGAMPIALCLRAKGWETPARPLTRGVGAPSAGQSESLHADGETTRSQVIRWTRQVVDKPKHHIELRSVQDRGCSKIDVDCS